MQKTLYLLLALVLAACGTQTTGSNTDPTAAQTFLPTVDGYTATDADSITDALGAAASEGADQFGNALVEQAVSRLDEFVACYQEVGAVSARVYTRVNISELLSSGAPAVGAVAVVNQDRVRENFVACAVGGDTAGAQGFSAQSASIQPCTGNGTFTAEDETLTYIYASTAPEFCSTVARHFGQYN